MTAAPTNQNTPLATTCPIRLDEAAVDAGPDPNSPDEQ